MEIILGMSGFEDTENLLDTVIFEGGKNLSGGVKQKIAVARALIKDSEIIIFDEASAHLDQQTKYLLDNNLSDIVKDKICIIITHDKEFSLLADRVYCLDQGVLEEKKKSKSLA